MEGDVGIQSIAKREIVCQRGESYAYETSVIDLREHE